MLPISCKLCNKNESSVQVGYKVNINFLYFALNGMNVKQYEDILRDNVEVGYRQLTTKFDHIHFYELMCKECYDFRKGKIVGVEGFKLEVQVLENGRYFYPNVGLP